MIILLGSVLLALPVAHKSGIHLRYIDALFTSTSAVCVTGLVTVDVAATFNLFGRTVVAVLIMVGGMGFAAVVMSIVMLLGWDVGISKRSIVSEAYNLGTLRGTLHLVKTVVFASMLFQTVGTIVGYGVFRQNYGPWDALGHSVFHAISAFNNAGFDILGEYRSLTGYRDNLVLNLLTAFLIIAGGLGFFVLRDIADNRLWRRLSMHSRIVLSVSFFLIVVGTLGIQLLDHVGFLPAFFQSVSSRTAGFNTIDIGRLSAAGLFFIMVLMFIGASPGSTGGGIKTTTALTLVLSLLGMASHREPAAFKRRIPQESVLKAFQTMLLALLTVCCGVFIISIAEGNRFSFLQISFESVSAFATVGLSTGITPQLGNVAKTVLIVTMYIGRLGPITVATSLKVKESVLKHVEERIFIG